MRCPFHSFRSSVYPNRNKPQTKPDCHECRSSPSVCRFGRCGNRRGIALHPGCCGRLEAVVLPSLQPSPTGEGVDVGMEKSSPNTFLIYINPQKSLIYLIPSTLPKNKEKAKKSFPIFCLLNFLTP